MCIYVTYSQNSAAFWLGNAKNEGLQRVYGISFPGTNSIIVVIDLYVCMCMFAYVFVRTYACLPVVISYCTRNCLWMVVCVHVRTCVYVKSLSHYVCMCVCVCLYVCLYVCVRMYVYVYDCG